MVGSEESRWIVASNMLDRAYVENAIRTNQIDNRLAIPHPLGRATHGVFARRSSAFVVLPLIENPSSDGASQELDLRRL